MARTLFATIPVKMLTWVILVVPFFYSLSLAAKGAQYAAYIAYTMLPPIGWLVGVYQLVF